MIDGMALLRTVKPCDILNTFAGLADYILQRVTDNFRSFNRVDFVVDTYAAMSIKNLERSRCTSSQGALRQRIAGGNQSTPKQFQKYLSVGRNKEELVAFFLAQWQLQRNIDKITSGKVLIITAGQECVTVKSTDGVIRASAIEYLASTHEEADTRLLHANHAADNGYETIVLKTLDTDVLVIACSVSHHIPCTLLLEIGAGNNRRMVDVTAVGRKLGAPVCNALPGLHAFTGCDSTSAFAFRGKRSAFDLLCGGGPESESARCVMGKLGQSFAPLMSDDMAAIEQFTCQLYKAPMCTQVNKARYELFCLKAYSGTSCLRAEMFLPTTLLEQIIKPLFGNCALCLSQKYPSPTLKAKVSNILISMYELSPAIFVSGVCLAVGPDFYCLQPCYY